MNKKQFVFIQRSPFPNPRVVKNIKVAIEENYKIVFLGAYKKRGLLRKEHWSGIEIKRLGIYYPDSSIWYFLGTPIFALSVFTWLIKHNPDKIHASDVEGILGVIPYKILTKKVHVFFNIHDNFSLRYSVPNWVRIILAKIEATLGSFADIVLVPDKSRLELLKPWEPDNIIIAPNTPPDPGYYSKTLNKKLRIFCPGLINWQRGFEILGKLILSRKDIELIICGSGPQKVVKYVKSLPGIKYCGYIPQDQSLKIGASCDLVFAYYDPSYKINIYASPNKLFDALAIGRPILINKETLVAKWVEKEKVGFSLPYGDLNALNQLINNLLENPQKITKTGYRGRKLYESHYKWSVVKEKIKKSFNEK